MKGGHKLKLWDIMPDTELEGIIDFSSNNITLETKRSAYDNILDSLAEKQKAILNHLNDSFPNGATAKELAVSMFNLNLVSSPERNSVHPRLNELVDINLVFVIGKKKCEYTNKTVAIYKCKQ